LIKMRYVTVLSSYVTHAALLAPILKGFLIRSYQAYNLELI